MKLGVIGGSGLYDFPDLNASDVTEVETPYGPPSDRLTTGRLGEIEIVFLPRHGAGHQHTPSELPYRANIYAFKDMGVTHVLSVSAVGSLREAVPPRAMALPDQIIDRTLLRDRSFFGDGAVAHVGIASPFCPEFRRTVLQAATQAGVLAVDGGTYLCIEGPQFSTRAESELYRSWGASVIGMTAMPEARLAREAELCYATLAMVTDYDVWHDDEEPVTVAMVVANLQANAEAGRDVVRRVAAAGLPERTCDCANALQNAIITSPDQITPETRRRLGVIADRYLAPLEG